MAHWNGYLEALDYEFSAEDEALIDKLVELGHFRSRDLGIFELLRNGLDILDLDELIHRMRQRQEILAEKKAKDILGDVYSDYVQQ